MLKILVFQYLCEKYFSPLFDELFKKARAGHDPCERGAEKNYPCKAGRGDPLVFKLFSGIPGTFFVTEANRPPGYVDPDELPDAENPYYHGRILFDEEGHWIYDDDQFTAGEQEQLAKFIMQ